MGFASSDTEFELENDFPMAPPTCSAPQNAFASTDSYATSTGVSRNDLINFASECCEEFGLTDGTKADVLRSAKLPLDFLMIRLYSRLLAFGQQVEHSTAAAFLESTDFKEHITKRLQSGLMDPKIPFYVRGTTQRFVRHITENPASYNIPPAVQSHFMHTKAFSQAVGTVLSNTRGEMKRKITKSIAEAQDINTLCRKLAPRGYRLTTEHAKQVAFLRTCLVEYNDLPHVPDSESRPSFWEFIDTKLDKLYLKTPAKQLKHFERNFTKDKDLYETPSGVSKLPDRATFLPWQVGVNNATLVMASYGITISQPDDNRPENAGQLEPGRSTRSESEYDAQTNVGLQPQVQPQPQLEPQPGGEFEYSFRPDPSLDLEPEPGFGLEERVQQGGGTPSDGFVPRTEHQVDFANGVAQSSSPVGVAYAHGPGQGTPACARGTNLHRGVFQENSLRGSSPRHDPLGLQSRRTHTLAAGSNSAAPSSSRGSSVSGQNTASQYNPIGSETGTATLGFSCE